MLDLLVQGDKEGRTEVVVTDVVAVVATDVVAVVAVEVVLVLAMVVEELPPTSQTSPQRKEQSLRPAEHRSC